MKYMYDTEFKEDGKTIDLISIGIVAEDGREFYRVSRDFDTERVAQDEWLMKNVMSSIDHVYFDTDPDTRQPNLIVTDDAARSRTTIARELLEFFGNDREIELWAWFGAYDHIALCQLFGKMIDLPRPMPMFTNDIMTLVTLKGPRTRFLLPKQPAGLHNALDDARFNWERYKVLTDEG